MKRENSNCQEVLTGPQSTEGPFWDRGPSDSTHYVDGHTGVAQIVTACGQKRGRQWLGKRCQTIAPERRDGGGGHRDLVVVARFDRVRFLQQLRCVGVTERG